MLLSNKISKLFDVGAEKTIKSIDFVKTRVFSLIRYKNYSEIQISVVVFIMLAKYDIEIFS